MAIPLSGERVALDSTPIDGKHGAHPRLISHTPGATGLRGTVAPMNAHPPLVGALGSALVSMFLGLALSACAADPASPVPAASGESHFLRACADEAECGGALACLCGVCSAACDDDAACAGLGARAVCSAAGACGEAPGGRVCARRADGGTTDASPPEADVPAPVCVAPIDGVCPPETLEVVRGRHIDVDRQCVGAGFDEPISCVTFMPGGSTAYFCVQRGADGARFGIPSGNCLPGAWSACEEGEFFMPAWPACPATPAPPAPPPGTPATCDPRALGLWQEPPSPETTGAVQRVDLAPDTLSVVAIVEGGEQTFTFHGPFATLDPAALAGLDWLNIQVGDGAGEDFIATLRGCDRTALMLVHATRPLLERTWGPVDDLFDPTVDCGGAGAGCPDEYALRWQGVSVPAGRSVDTLDAQLRAGRVTGCRGDPGADARVEFVVLPRADVPACPGAGVPGENASAFAMTDAAGAIVAANEGMDVDRTDEVVVTQDPADPGHLTLTPVAADAGFGPLNLRVAISLPAEFVPPVTLRQRLTTPWHWNRTFEVHDAGGLRITALSGDRSVLAGLTNLTATPGAPVCRMPWDVGVQDLQPLTLLRGGVPPRTAIANALGVTRFDGGRVDLRASGDYVNVCATDTPRGWVDFVAVWD